MKMKKGTIKMVCVVMMFLSLMLNYSLNETLVSASRGTGIETYAYKESLPIKYEIWYSYMYGAERRNEQYKDYTFQNGYNSTNTLVGRIQLTPLQYEFYSKAESWKVTYTFY